MKKVKTSAPILEQSCPACGGLFTVSAASRRKKVQCPQCREIVSLTPPDELNGKPETDAAPDWMARCEMLQARIEALEHQVEALMVTPRTRAPLIPGRAHDFGPVSRQDLLPGDLPEGREGASHADGGERREVFRMETPSEETAPRGVVARTFQLSAPEIGLLVSAGDGAARQMAETLTTILAGSGWKVRGVTEDQATALACSGLTLVASPALPLQRVTSTFNAMREAGFAVTFQLDPERGTGETLLIVGAATGPENEAGLEKLGNR